MEEPTLNAHNKLEYEPAHSCEHLLNATMVKMFGCPRSRNAHVEKKKSKCDYILDAEHFKGVEFTTKELTRNRERSER